MRFELVFFLFLACSIKGPGEKSNTENDANFVEVSEQSIVGKWTVSATVIDSLSVQCNYCPEFFFERDGTGQIISARGKKYAFDWSLSKPDTVRLKLAADQDIRVILICEQKSFVASISQDSTSVDLYLKTLQGDCVYVLSRSR